MCTGAELAIIGLGAASTVATMTQKAPKPPEVPTPEKPPQAAKAPDVEPLKRKNQSAAAAFGPASTFLTGAGGVDPSSLNLGKTTLLGG
jgi:hypothetical protein